MDNMNNKQAIRLSEIDFTQLMDLRIDFAFKLLFTKGSPRLLISLLNAVFANKKINRIIKSIIIKNPYLDKESSEDKLSILDIRAELDDGTAILIEMHMYGLGELKSKTIRSWARAFGEELEVSESYTGQPPAIAITFANGQVKSMAVTGKPAGNSEKIHRLCMIMDCEDFTVFTDAMELHYIDMNAFAKAVNKTGSIHINDTEEVMFLKWLSIITQKEITDKTIIADVCKNEEEIQMAVSTLSRQGEDKITRQSYQRRLDEIYYYNKSISDNTRRAEAAERTIAEKDGVIAEKDSVIEENNRAMKEKDSVIEEKDAIIAQLKARLGEE